MSKCNYCHKAIKGTSSAYLMSERTYYNNKHEKECSMNPKNTLSNNGDAKE
jgi:hypothetical protein